MLQLIMATAAFWVNMAIKIQAKCIYEYHENFINQYKKTFIFKCTFLIKVENILRAIKTITSYIINYKWP
jgi:hypothetical protein